MKVHQPDRRESLVSAGLRLVVRFFLIGLAIGMFFVPGTRRQKRQAVLAQPEPVQRLRLFCQGASSIRTESSVRTTEIRVIIHQCFPNHTDEVRTMQIPKTAAGERQRLGLTQDEDGGRWTLTTLSTWLMSIVSNAATTPHTQIRGCPYLPRTTSSTF